MDRLTVRDTSWRGVDAWMIAGPELEVVVTRTGAHLAAIRTPGDELNPLWQPPWPAAAPADGAARPAVYGEGPEASLLAGIVGHNLCVDRFGPPWPGESRPVHGEAGVVAWTQTGGADDSFALEARLDEAGLRVARVFEVDGDRLVITTEVVHGSDSPRQIEWAEHVTLGDPFLDGATFDAGVDAGWIFGGEPRSTWRFPDAEAEGPVDPASALAMPGSGDPPAGDIVTMRVADGWFRAERADLARAIEYRWNAGEFPWLCVWTQHRSRMGRPWNAVTRARGLEFSTKPFPEGEPPASRAEEFHGSPTVCIVPPGAGLRREFSVRWSRV
jgi:hypothetical protein